MAVASDRRSLPIVRMEFELLVGFGRFRGAQSTKDVLHKFDSIDSIDFPANE
jgi:hypothetical protein